MKQEITLPIKWIERLKYYTEGAKSSQGELRNNAIIALLGYLESLEFLVEKESSNKYPFLGSMEDTIRKEFKKKESI